MVPPEESVSNLLSVCAPSASHVGFQAFRVEPTFMVMGEAAGVASGVSALRGTQPRGLGAAALQAALRQQGAILTAAEMKPAAIVGRCTAKDRGSGGKTGLAFVASAAPELQQVPRPPTAPG